MIFASDNWAGASPKLLSAVTAAMAGPPAPAYGGDAWTRRAEAAIRELFEHPDAVVFLLASGTAANVLAVTQLTPPWGAVYCSAQAHLHTTECGATEAIGGLKLVPIAGAGAKVTPAALDAAVATAWRGNAHCVQPATLSITNLTECGTRYRPGEIAALAAACRAHGLALHMDGARFANAVAAEGCTPAEATWKAGVDVLSLGATKCGALLAEAVVVFDPARAEGLQYRRMRAGHLLSKMRFVAAQFEAWLDGGHWLDLAGHANAMARRLAEGLTAVGVRLAWPAEGNLVFAIYPEALAARLEAAGAVFHRWAADGLPHGVRVEPGEQVVRHVCAFTTTAGEVDALLAEVRAGWPRALARN